jgi:hypothetical protein
LWSDACTNVATAAAQGGDNVPAFGIFRRMATTTVAMVGPMMLRACFLGILMAATTLPVGAGERMTIKVSPAVAFAPANLVVRTTIEADAGNRAVEIVAESQDFYRSSEIHLEGDKAARTTTFEFRSLPPGTYEVRAKLLGADGQARAAVRQQVNVIASGSGDRF